MKRPPLSKGEMEVARVIWDLGECSVGDVFEKMPKPRRVDYATVQTYIRRLEAKGYLKTRRQGRNKIYSPKVEPDKVIGRAVDDFMKQLFDGDAIPLIRHLVQDRGMSDEELHQLRSILEQAEDEHGDDD